MSGVSVAPFAPDGILQSADGPIEASVISRLRRTAERIGLQIQDGT
jgi:hypothetical protein